MQVATLWLPGPENTEGVSFLAKKRHHPLFVILHSPARVTPVHFLETPFKKPVSVFSMQ